jgi:hypothetical protein
MSSFTKHCTIFFFTFISSIGFSQTINWDWVKHAGGGSDDVGYSITSDNSGNIIVTGLFNTTALFDELQITSMTYWGGGFIAKYDSLGNIQWVDKISGTRSTYINAITADLNNNIYVCGNFSETTYADTFSLTSNGSGDAFIGKYSANGNLLWLKSAGGIDLDGAISLICADSLLFVAGEFRDSVYFDTTLLVSSGNSDIFLACLDFEGNYQWIKQAGGSYYDVARSISIDNNSDIIIAGHINTSANFGVTDTSVFTYGSIDPFVAKYSSTGEFLWVNSFGGIDEDRGISVISDIDNNLFLHGHFYGTAYFDTITLQSTGIEDYFICKLQPNGNVVWANKIETRIDPYDDFWNHSLESDEQGNIYITGYFMDSLVYDSFSVQSNGSYDIFVIKIDNNGELLWCLTAGNDHPYGDYSRSIARDDNGNLFITGRFYSTLFFGDSSITSNGSDDIFIAKISETPLNVEFVRETMQIDIFPNPASSFLNIISGDNEIQEVEIIDNNGKLISSYKNTNMNHIDVSGLPKGVYFVKVIFRNMTITRKVIII